jgi:peroxin-4
MASKQVTKRLLHELRSYEKDPSDALLHLGPINDQELTHWTAVLKGLPDTAYQSNSTNHSTLPLHLSNQKQPDGLWKLNIIIPDTYPNKPPTITFVTPICHPNVHFKTGEICLDLLKSSWSPVYSIKQTLEAVQQLLTSAEPDSPLNIDAAQLLRQGDHLGYEALVRFYTETLTWIEE